jgi:hypothetical protein
MTLAAMGTTLLCPMEAIIMENQHQMQQQEEEQEVVVVVEEEEEEEEEEEPPLAVVPHYPGPHLVHGWPFPASCSQSTCGNSAL